MPDADPAGTTDDADVGIIVGVDVSISVDVDVDVDVDVGISVDVIVSDGDCNSVTEPEVIRDTTLVIEPR